MRRVLLLCLPFLAPAPSLAVEPACYEIPLAKLVKDAAARDWVTASAWSRRAGEVPRVLLPEGGEGYVERPEGGRFGGTLHVRLPARSPCAGVLFVPKSGGGMASCPFRIEPGKTREGSAAGFETARRRHYERLLDSGATGAAWFRHQADLAGRAGGRPPARPVRNTTLHDTYAMITGGRALSENLALEQVLASTVNAGSATVDLGTIEGITVPACDWKALLGDRQPALDPLASLVPADQHALFFPSFAAMTKLLDEADEAGTPVLHWLQASAVDSRTRARYERQLLLGMSELARRLGPHVVKSVAMTGSDLYLRTGTDVAILFQAKNAALLDALLRANRRVNLGDASGVTAKELRLGGTVVDAIVTPGRRVSSYQARVGPDAVAVTNSLVELRALLDAAAGVRPALATFDEYRFFRSRYRLEEPETAFLIITDATLRRWCGPRWRIAASRRTKAAALLAEMICRRIEVAAGCGGPLPAPSGAFDLGEVSLAEGPPLSSIYGRFDFLTPISELQFTKVTPAEKEGYAAWRRGYERNFEQFYDPIAGRIAIEPEKVSLDFTVLPLKLSSDYANLVELAGKSKIRPGAGDPHPDALAHCVFAVDQKSRPMREIGSFTLGLSGDERLSILDWIGETVAIYLDPGPFFDGLEKAEDPEKYFEEAGPGLPLALRVDIRNPLKFLGFIMAARALAAVSAPNMLVFETRKYRDRIYTRIAPDPSRAEESGFSRRFEIFYTSWAGTFFVTLDEGVLKRAIDRDLDRKEDERATPWLGESVALRANADLIRVLDKVGGRAFMRHMRDRSFGNLPILNEWKRLFPGEDPVAVHERYFGVRPICPGGGTYRWDGEFRTMASRVFGHPASPRDGPTLPGVVRQVTEAAFGLTFCDGGMRARCEISRKAKEK